MDTAYISALAALAGSAIGAFSSFATTWLSQNTKFRLDRRERESGRRETLYGAFIDEASRLFADAVLHDIADTAQLVPLYSLVNRMRLFAPPDIIRDAEGVMALIIDHYREPNRQIGDLRNKDFDAMDPLRKFSETCRNDLMSILD